VSAPARDLAGAIVVRLQVRDGRVAAVELQSSRPTDLSRRLFVDHGLDRLLATLPLVYSICATAQAAAAVQAGERALGVEPEPAHQLARAVLVDAETAREHLFRLLTAWPEWLGETPAREALAMLGRQRMAWTRALYPDADAFACGGGRLDPDRAQAEALVGALRDLLGRVVGADGAVWPALVDAAGLLDWVGRDESLAQRMLGHLVAQGHDRLGRSGVGLLPALPDAELAALLAAPAADGFVARPSWQGESGETGALQREAESPLVADLLQQRGNDLLTRLVARLAELHRVIDRLEAGLGTLAPAQPGGMPSAREGEGLAQVDAARGVLVHWLRLEGGSVAGHRILAPTEWNFHPQGALAQGLAGLPAGPDLAGLARLLVDAVDPCVACHVEVNSDA
jgi:uptake hydrogenase large subunit